VGTVTRSHCLPCLPLSPLGPQMNCLVALVDPPRPEAKEAVTVCHSAGIAVKMITGDHADTATTIGSWLGIVTEETLTGPQVNPPLRRFIARRFCLLKTMPRPFVDRGYV
jgi:magnesium-transporting ATPase (P-type)